MPSQRTVTISQKHNQSEIVWQTIENLAHLNIVIDDIKADNTINVEVLQFFSVFSVCKYLESKRKQVVKELSETHEDARRRTLIAQLDRYTEEEKQMRINILLTAHGFQGMKYSPLMQEVADLFFAGDTQAAFQKLNPETLENTQAQILSLIKNEIELEKIVVVFTIVVFFCPLKSLQMNSKGFLYSDGLLGPSGIGLRLLS
jgi:hypothetical protein